MNCEEFENNVNDLAREQIMEASIRARVLAHGHECETCAQRLDDERALSFKLHALAIDTSSAKVPAMGNELRAALRGRQPAMILPAGSLARRYRATIAGVMAVAAMVLIVVAVAVIRSRSATPAAQNPSHPSNNALVKAPDVVSDSPAPLPKKNPATERRKVARKDTKLNRIVVPSQSVASVVKDAATIDTAPNVNADDAAEITSDFMPVGYTSATSLQDGGQLVRVELPRSALVAFGLPMNVNRYDERVKADVFFGADGMARAIRFVQ